MRRLQRLIAAAVAIALSSALAGCAGGMSSFDPSDLLDFLDTKKKLPGERKPVFPQGVPGLEQGVPKDLYKGSRQEQIDQQNAPPGGCGRRLSTAARAEPKAKRAAKPRGAKPPAGSAGGRAAAAPDPDAAPEEEGGPLQRRRLQSPRRSCAGAPRRHRPIKPRSRASPRNRRNNLLRHSRPRCRAAPLRANFVFID